MNKLLIYFFLLFPFVAYSKAFIPDRFQLLFVKELKSLLNKQKKSEGVLTYQHPGKIRIEQKKPFKTLYVSNGRQAWLYSAPLDPEREKGEVTVLDPQKIPLAEVLGSLRKGLVSNKIYSVSKQGAVYTLTFRPKSKEQYRVESVKVEMSSAHTAEFGGIKALTVKSENALEKYQLVEITTPPPFPPAHFDFKITDKMKVTEAR